MTCVEEVANFAFTEFYEDEMRRPTPRTQYPKGSASNVYGL
jgi:hypothetical protein